MTAISTLGEFGLIDHLTRELPRHNTSTVVSVGDDCAVLHHADEEVLVTTDMLMEGIHFDLTYTDMQYLGYKSAMVNLSDVFAMNGIPRQITVSLALDKRFSIEDIDAFYRGLRHACDKWHVDIVGGDTTSSLTGLAISITCIGTARKEDIVYRNGAKHTDLICVSGNLGAAFMGLKLLEREKKVYYAQLAEEKKRREEKGERKEVSMEDAVMQYDFQPDYAGHEYLLSRILQPEARGDIVEALRNAHVRPTAMIDVSDGLSSEIRHICKQSECGCRIYEKNIPIDYQTASLAEELNMNVYTAALNGGEDYELLFTVPVGDYAKVEQIADVHVIGHITDNAEEHVFVTRDEQHFDLKAQGWNPLK